MKRLRLPTGSCSSKFATRILLMRLSCVLLLLATLLLVAWTPAATAGCALTGCDGEAGEAGALSGGGGGVFDSGWLAALLNGAGEAGEAGVGGRR